MKTCRILGLLLVAMLALTTVAGAQTYQLAASWSFEASQLGLVAAQDEGLYKQNGVDIKVERGFGAADTVRRLIAGNVQFGYIDAMVLIKAKAEDPKLDIIMVANLLQTSPFGAVYIKGRNVKGIADLSKAKFGDSGGSVAQLYAPFVAHALKTQGGAPSYPHITIDPAVRISALFRGDVDTVAAMLFEVPVIDYRAKEADLGLGVFPFAENGFNSYTYGLAVRRSFAEQHPDVVRAVVKGSLEGWAWACSHVPAATTLLMKYQKDAPAATMEPEVQIGLKAIESPDTQTKGLGYMSKARWQQTYDLAVSSWGLKPNAVDLPQVWTDAYMPAKPIGIGACASK